LAAAVNLKAEEMGAAEYAAKIARKRIKILLKHMPAAERVAIDTGVGRGHGAARLVRPIDHRPKVWRCCRRSRSRLVPMSGAELVF
jgi:hypothetical protein